MKTERRTCFGTWPRGRGTWVRHAANDAGARIGARVESVPGTSAADNEREKATADGVESFVPEAAQQLSAWACVTTLSEPPPGSVDPCIGHSPLPEQHAIRASGEVCQPAHSAHPAAASASATTKAAVRLSSSSTILGCTGATLVSIQWGTGARACTVARGARARGTRSVKRARTRPNQRKTRSR